MLEVVFPREKLLVLAPVLAPVTLVIPSTTAQKLSRRRAAGEASTDARGKATIVVVASKTRHNSLLTVKQ